MLKNQLKNDISSNLNVNIMSAISLNQQGIKEKKKTCFIVFFLYHWELLEKFTSGLLRCLIPHTIPT